MPESFHLDRLFQRYPDWPVMREAARSWRRQWTRNQAAGQPLTGAFYWVPVPGPDRHVTWEIQEFFDAWRPSSDHAYVWRHVRDSLEWHWKRDLRAVGYCSLPRGRVCRSFVRDPGRTYQVRLVVYHGGDRPTPTDWDLIRWKFNLGRDCLIAEDVHERMLPEDRASLAVALGIKLQAALKRNVEVSHPKSTWRHIHG